ncbi:MAG: DUF4203 domain-containing protein [Vicinamibacterales bacterium]
MLPAAYQLPAAIVLILSGALSCFFGHRLFRVVLLVFGFLIGALAASSIFGMRDTTPMLIAALVGGILGALILRAAYFVGVALVGAALGATIAHLAFSALGKGDPGVWVVVLAAVGFSVAAVYLQRYFIIVGTAFGGAWTLLVGAMALVGDRAAMAAAIAGDAWVIYPLDPAPGRRWVPVVWAVVGLIGTAVQLGFTGGDKGRVGSKKK